MWCKWIGVRRYKFTVAVYILMTLLFGVYFDTGNSNGFLGLWSELNILKCAGAAWVTVLSQTWAFDGDVRYSACHILQKNTSKSNYNNINKPKTSKNQLHQFNSLFATYKFTKVQGQSRDQGRRSTITNIGYRKKTVIECFELSSCDQYISHIACC